MRSKTIYAHVGETVRIVIPKIFERCGYPLTVQMIRVERQKEIEVLVSEAYKAIVLKHNEPERKRMGVSDYDAVVAYSWDNNFPNNFVGVHLENAVCSYLLQKEHFGGKERKVYERELPEIEGAVAEITGKRFVRTGTYSRGYVSSADGGDWEPNYLDNQRTHCLYQIAFRSPVHTSSFLLKEPLEIIATNCSRGIPV